MFFRNELRLLLVLVAFMLLYYGALITKGDFNFLQRYPIGLTFNSMLEHLLHGQFDVDPEAVRKEGYLRDGRVYAYWGIFCALIRLPLLAFKSGLMTDVTVLSCLIAICLAGAMKLRAALFVRRYCQPGHLTLSPMHHIRLHGRVNSNLKSLKAQGFSSLTAAPDLPPNALEPCSPKQRQPPSSNSRWHRVKVWAT